MKTENEKRPKKYRAHGLGSLEKRGKKYFARWMVNGKRFTRSTGESSIEKAREKLEEFTRPYRIGNEIDALEATEVRIKGREAELKTMAENRAALTVDQLYGVYKDTPECQDTTRQTAALYESVLTALAKWLRENKPEMIEARKVSRHAAREYAKVLEKNFAATTCNIYIRMLRRVWRTIARNENLELEEDGRDAYLCVLEEQRTLARFEFNPWEDVPPVSVVGKQHSRRELTVEELKRVCASVTGEMRVLFAIGIYTGLRFGDCAQMDWSEIDLVRGLISVTPRKTKKKSGMSVVIPIHNVLRNVLMETPEARRVGKVLPECDASYRRSKVALSNQVQRIFNRCGIATICKVEGKKHGRSDVGFHSLRHTFVSMAANAGAPLELVRKIVGHTSPAMTRHYFHADEKALRETVAQLPNVTTIGGGGASAVAALPSAEGQRSNAACVARICGEVAGMVAADRLTVAQSAADGLDVRQLESLRDAIDIALELKRGQNQAAKTGGENTDANDLEK